MTIEGGPGPLLDQVEAQFELKGWTLFWARLETTAGHLEELAELRDRTVKEVRQDLEVATLASHPTVAALRRLFREAGTDPTRYRPSSEALLRRILKGADLPAIHPLVDINNCLSLRLAVPCCVMAEESVDAPFILRAGRPGESYESLKGPFELEGRPLLVDARGPCDAPITGSQRVKIREGTSRAWLVAYLPEAEVSLQEAGECLDQLLAQAPVARRLGSRDRPAETEEPEDRKNR